MATVMLNAKVCESVLREQLHAHAKGYDRAHDDARGSGQLVTEAVYRLTHMGEYPTDEAVRHEIIVAIGLLFNAVETLDRALESGHTVTV
ncbi:MAG TPA: hypothetical protein VN108_00960 [Marmoricola sp.]|nr:hypothetical protein [Marmoricola sp.]